MKQQGGLHTGNGAKRLTTAIGKHLLKQLCVGTDSTLVRDKLVR